MISWGSRIIEFAPLWTWALFVTRFTGLLFALPGIGTEQIPKSFRYWAVLTLALAAAVSGSRAKEPAHTAELLLMLGSEFLLGVFLGAIPSFVVSGVAVAGQAIAGAIGLAQASMIDASLGTNTVIFSRIKAFIASAIFLSVGGHHTILKVASATTESLALGFFRPDATIAEAMIKQLVSSFDLALAVSAPVLITALITQFILGLLTKFIPQLNVFLITLPLLILVGFYIIELTLPELRYLLIEHYASSEQLVLDFAEVTGGNSTTELSNNQAR